MRVLVLVAVVGVEGGEEGGLCGDVAVSRGVCTVGISGSDGIFFEGGDGKGWGEHIGILDGDSGVSDRMVSDIGWRCGVPAGDCVQVAWGVGLLGDDGVALTGGVEGRFGVPVVMACLTCLTLGKLLGILRWLARSSSMRILGFCG